MVAQTVIQDFKLIISDCNLSKCNGSIQEMHSLGPEAVTWLVNPNLDYKKYCSDRFFYIVNLLIHTYKLPFTNVDI